MSLYLPFVFVVNGLGQVPATPEEVMDFIFNNTMFGSSLVVSIDIIDRHCGIQKELPGKKNKS